MPPALFLVVGAIGAAIVARRLAREWKRINRELERAKAAQVDAERKAAPVLRRDPQTGVYSPNRRDTGS